MPYDAVTGWNLFAILNAVLEALPGDALVNWRKTAEVAANELRKRTARSLKLEREKFERDLAELRKQNVELAGRVQELSNPKKDEGKGQPDAPKPPVSKNPAPKSAAAPAPKPTVTPTTTSRPASTPTPRPATTPAPKPVVPSKPTPKPVIAAKPTAPTKPVQSKPVQSKPAPSKPVYRPVVPPKPAPKPVVPPKPVSMPVVPPRPAPKPAPATRAPSPVPTVKLTPTISPKSSNTAPLDASSSLFRSLQEKGRQIEAQEAALGALREQEAAHNDKVSAKLANWAKEKISSVKEVTKETARRVWHWFTSR